MVAVDAIKAALEVMEAREERTDRMPVLARTTATVLVVWEELRAQEVLLPPAGQQWLDLWAMAAIRTWMAAEAVEEATTVVAVGTMLVVEVVLVTRLEPQQPSPLVMRLAMDRSL